MTTEEKLDRLLRNVEALVVKQDALAEQQESSQRDLDAKLKKLEQAQEEATERAIKRTKRDRPTDFKKRGHREQFEFNEAVEDRLDAATKKMKRLAPSDADKKIVQEAIEELQEGMDAITERQKHIRIADVSRWHWRTVDMLKAGGRGISDEEKKRVKEVERDLADQYNEKKRPANEGRLPRPPYQQASPQWQYPLPQQFPQQWQPPSPPQQLNTSLPRFQPRQQHRPPGPCFNCYEMGHLKVNCPKLARLLYPF